MSERIRGAPADTETFAVDLSLNICIKYIGKIVDTEGFKPILRLVEVCLFLKLPLHLVTFGAIFDSRKTLYIYKVR